MKYQIYQIPLNEKTRHYAFERKEDLEKRGMYPPPRELYQLVYEDECDRIDPVALLHLHNRDDRPARKRIRSMSTSDILIYAHKGERLALFRDYVYFWPILFTDDKTEDISTEYTVKDGYAHILLTSEGQTVDINVAQMLNGGLYFKNTAGEKVKLTLTQIYTAYQATVIEQDKLKYNGKPKTFDEWTESGAIDFDSYVGMGNEVDEAIVGNFLELLPPACHTSHLMQMGEPNEHLPDEKGNFLPTFMTFEKVEGKWYYRGYCFHCETRNQKRMPTFAETIAKLIK